MADLAPGDYALGVTKMFMRAGKGKFLEDLKEKPVDEVLPVLKRKLVEWEAKRRATPLIAKWLHMQVKRCAYKRQRRVAIVVQSRRRGTVGRRRAAALMAARPKRGQRSYGAGRGGLAAEAKEVARLEAEAVAEAKERAEVEAEVRRDCIAGIVSPRSEREVSPRCARGAAGAARDGDRAVGRRRRPARRRGRPRRGDCAGDD